MESSQFLHRSVIAHHNTTPAEHMPIHILLSRLDPNDVENFQKSRKNNSIIIFSKNL